MNAPFTQYQISGRLDIPVGGILAPTKKRITIDLVTIQGNTITEDRVIRHELVGLTTGAEFKPKNVFAAEEALLRRGIFDADSPPRIEVLPSPRGERYCDLVVRVTETRTDFVVVERWGRSNPVREARQARGALSWLVDFQPFDSADTPINLCSFASIPNRRTDMLQPRKPLINVSFADLGHSNR